MNLTDRRLPRCAPAILGLLYAGLIGMSALRGYFHLVELPWYATQFAYAAIIALAAVWVFYSGEMSRNNLALNVMLVQMLPNLLILVWSVGLWVSREEPLPLILRGSSLVLYQLLLLVMVMAAGILFGRRIIEYTAMGFILANTLILLDVMRRNGVGATLSGMLSFLVSAGASDNAISLQLEVQDVTFGIAILLLYYILEGKQERRRWFYIAALGFYFLLGFKRILFPAIALGGLYWLLVKRLKPREQKTVSVAIGLMLMAVSLGYVVLVRTGLWVALCDRLGIDLMGRARLYGYMETYYDISPAFLGMGNGKVSTVLEVLEKTGNRRLHSDVLRLYIELGMAVFLLWCYLTFIFTYTHLNKKYSPRVAGIYMTMTLLMFVTFLTDNTLEKYCPEIAWHLLPLAIAFQERDRMIAALHDLPVQAHERNGLWTKEKKGFPSSRTPGDAPQETPAEALRQFRRETWRDRP